MFLKSLFQNFLIFIYDIHYGSKGKKFICSEETTEPATPGATEETLQTTTGPSDPLATLFPYYNEEEGGAEDYDLLPFYDVEEYDLALDDNFLLYDTTDDDDIQRK